jgi:hypothetical protein
MQTTMSNKINPIGNTAASLERYREYQLYSSMSTTRTLPRINASATAGFLEDKQLTGS